MEHHEELHRKRTLEDPHAGEASAHPGCCWQGPLGLSVAVTALLTCRTICGVVFVTLSIINHSLKLSALIWAVDLVCSQIT